MFKILKWANGAIKIIPMFFFGPERLDGNTLVVYVGVLCGRFLFRIKLCGRFCLGLTSVV